MGWADVPWFPPQHKAVNDGFTTKLYDSWRAIENPYEIFKMVKQTSVNIKTDFNYPNALKPNTNPGYNTKYEPKE